MTASSATYPALDAARPAGLSQPIIQGELRQGLGFNGVTITDAGMDVLLFSNKTVGEGAEGLKALTNALKRGRLGWPIFQASVERVLELRQDLATRKPRTAP